MTIPVSLPCEKLHSALYYSVCAAFPKPWPPWLQYLWWYKDALLRFLDGQTETPYIEAKSLRPSVFARDLSANILSNFHENLLRNVHTLLKVVNKCITSISMCCDWIGYSWAHRISMWCLLGNTILVKSGSVKRAFYLGKSTVKCTLVQALRFCTGRTAHRGRRDIALLFLDHGTRREWGVRFTPRPLFTPEKTRYLNETPTWCNTVQVSFLQSHSTCFGRQASIIRSI